MVVNYYTLLKIEASANTDAIKKAFRREIRLYHPDNNPAPEAKDIFEKLIEAFEVLSDDKKRRTYDTLLESQTHNKPVLVQQEKQYQDWQKQAKTKSKRYRDFGLEELLLLDIFILNGDILSNLISGADDLVDGLSDGLGDIFDLF